MRAGQSSADAALRGTIAPSDPQSRLHPRRARRQGCPPCNARSGRDSSNRRVPGRSSAATGGSPASGRGRISHGLAACRDRLADVGASGTCELGPYGWKPGATKNDEGRVFPFTTLRSREVLLRDQRALTDAVERAEDLICPWGFHRTGRPIKNFRGAWEAGCIAAGFFRVAPVPGGHREGRKKATKLFHDFRRTAGRNLERAGVLRSVAMKLTGHKTEAVYRRYAIVSEADLTQGVKKLNSCREGESNPHGLAGTRFWSIAPGSADPCRIASSAATYVSSS